MLVRLPDLTSLLFNEQALPQLVPNPWNKVPFTHLQQLFVAPDHTEPQGNSSHVQPFKGLRLEFAL